MKIDKLLEAKGLKFDDLTPDEREVYYSWIQALETNKLSVESIRESITQSKHAIELELTDIRPIPQTWLSLLSFLIPLIGIVRKTYQDQRELELRARLRNYILLENMLTSPERAKKAIEKQIGNIKT